MSDDVTLLPCPFCGAAGMMIDENRTTKVQIMCGADCELVPQTEWRERDQAIAIWNTRIPSPDSGERMREALALKAIKAVTATAMDGAKALSRIMAIATSAGVKQQYSELLSDPHVALIVQRPRAEWRHLFEPACTIPPEGWRCTRKPGHNGPCAAVAAPQESAR